MFAGNNPKCVVWSNFAWCCVWLYIGECVYVFTNSSAGTIHLIYIEIQSV